MTNGLDGNGYTVPGKEQWKEYESCISFDSGKICEKHKSIFDNHLRYFHYGITNPYKVRILGYAECLCEILYPACYIYHPI